MANISFIYELNILIMSNFYIEISFLERQFCNANAEIKKRERKQKTTVTINNKINTYYFEFLIV